MLEVCTIDMVLVHEDVLQACQVHHALHLECIPVTENIAAIMGFIVALDSQFVQSSMKAVPSCPTVFCSAGFDLDQYIWASVTLYLDIINLFLKILQLLNGRRD